MRIGAVKLYEPHYFGTPDNLTTGVGCVKVFPIAIGNFIEQRQPCGTVIVPSESATRKIVVAISKWDASHGFHSWDFPDRRKDDRIHTTRFYVKDWETYGDYRDNPKWPWTCALVTPARLIPATEYENAEFLFQEWEASANLAERHATEAQKVADKARSDLIGMLLTATEGSGISISNLYIDEVGAFVVGAIDIQAALDYAVKKRRLTRAQAKVFPFKGTVNLTSLDDVFSYVGKPKGFDELKEKAISTKQEAREACEVSRELASCNPRY